MLDVAGQGRRLAIGEEQRVAVSTFDGDCCAAFVFVLRSSVPDGGVTGSLCRAAALLEIEQS